MSKFRKYLLKLLIGYFRAKQFVFRFQYYTGTDEESGQINDTNVVQYRFINQGTSVCLINEGELQPGINPGGAINLIPGKEFVLEVRSREKDVTIYKYKFLDVLGKTCSGEFTMLEFFAQSSSCDFTVQLFIAGNAIINPIVINSANSVADIQALVDANIVPGFTGTIVVSRPPATNDLVFSVTGVELGENAPETFTATISVSGLCEVVTDSTFSCILDPAPINKLLVISKVIANI